MQKPSGRAPSDWRLPPGWALQYRLVTESTNDDARRATVEGCPDRSVFLADLQTRGRGRQGRSWVAALGQSLLFSLVLRRPIAPVYQTALCSVSIARAIRRTTGLDARIKWPNDLMVRDRKVCGILTEVVRAEAQPATIVGIGLNVNLALDTPGLPPTATSLSFERGIRIDREAVFHAIASEIDTRLTMSVRDLYDAVRTEWQALLWRRNQVVRIDDDEATLEGIVLGLTGTGALRIETPEGRTVEVAVGDLVIDA